MSSLSGVSVRAIAEGLRPVVPPAVLLPGFTLDKHRHGTALGPEQFDAAGGLLRISIHSWLVRTGHHTILIDTCVGNDKERRHPAQAEFHRLRTDYLDGLRRAGVEPEDVDFVVNTHLHADHCGWNTRWCGSAWRPTFPNARYVMSEHESEHWGASASDFDHPNGGVYADSVAPLFERGQVDFAERLGMAIADGVDLLPAPGHTPGMLMVRVVTRGPTLLFAGDLLHHAVQIIEPDQSSCFCDDPLLAASTRRRVIGEIADRDVLLFPAHIGAPHVMRVVSRADRFAPVFGYE